MRVCRLALRCIGARAGFVSVRGFVGACACVLGLSLGATGCACVLGAL